jgi:hypothetical protein
MGRGPEIVLTGSLILGVLAGAIAVAGSPQIVSFAPLAQSTVQPRSLSSSAFRPGSIPESTSYPTLVKAVLPQRPSAKASLLNRRRGTASMHIARQNQPAPGSPEFIVLTEWEDSAPSARLAITFAADHSSSYAAISVANGWLIVQI